MPDAVGPKIVIAGTREDWPGGAQTLTPRDPTREPNGRILWFGAALDADGSVEPVRCSCRSAHGHERRAD